MKYDVIDLDNKKIASVDLSDAIFGVEVREDIIARVIDWQLAGRRAGTHKTKGISDVSGTTKKPFKQKGTGNARQGSLRSPQFKGGATIFGPVVRDHSYSLNKKIRALGLKSALSEKAKNGKLIIVDSLEMAEPKTKVLSEKLVKLGWKDALVINIPENSVNFALASSNIVGIDMLPPEGANVYDIVKRDTLVVAKDALEKLEARLQ
jgi:large subunit ribosomal protein L4